MASEGTWIWIAALKPKSDQKCKDFELKRLKMYFWTHSQQRSSHLLIPRINLSPFTKDFRV